jgi:hypothetical protein
MTVALRDRSIPPTMMPHMWSAVGAIVVSWAFVEQNLDMLATVAFTSCGGDKIQVTAHPPLGQNAITSAMPTDPVAGERVGRHGAIEPSG